MVCLLCAGLSACFFEQKPFLHSLKTGRYISDGTFTVGDLEISYFELELTEGDRMQYVKPAGKSMIKDLSTVNVKFYTVLRGKISLCVNGKNEEFKFEDAKALNYKTETEYKLNGLHPVSDNSENDYSSLNDFIITTLDKDGDGVAEALDIKLGDAAFTAVNNDILYSFTLRDDTGIFGTKGVRELYYFDYQTVVLRDFDVVSFTYDGSHESKYHMPIITLSSGEVLTPALEKADGVSSVDSWLFEFPMPSHNISGTVSEIEVNKADFEKNGNK